MAAWSCKLCTQQQMVTNVTVITNASVGMQLFIAHQREVGGQGAVVAAFRGTEVISLTHPHSCMVLTAPRIRPHHRRR